MKYIMLNVNRQTERVYNQNCNIVKKKKNTYECRVLCLILSLSKCTYNHLQISTKFRCVCELIYRRTQITIRFIHPPPLFTTVHTLWLVLLRLTNETSTHSIDCKSLCAVGGVFVRINACAD